MRSLPDDNLAYPVTIEIGPSFGSGFFITTESAYYLVTARHVILDSNFNLLAASAKTTATPADISIPGNIVHLLDLATLQANGDILFDRTHDVAVIHIGDTKPDPTIEKRMVGHLRPGINETRPPNASVATCPIFGIRRYSDVLIANEVFILGYPVSIGLKNSPQFDQSRPLLRRGIVAGKYDAKQTIILDCPVYKGNSGGPVIQIEEHQGIRKCEIIGVVSEFVPLEETWTNQMFGYSNVQISNSGYSVVSAMDSVLHLIGI